jgi:prophage regulatory protein
MSNQNVELKIPTALKSVFDIDPILSLSEVLKATSLKKTAVYHMIDAGLFPRQVRLGARRVGWRQSAIREWINSRPYVNGITQQRGK